MIESTTTPNLDIMNALLTELLRSTEAASIAASNWIGSGNKEAIDKAAVDAMRFSFQSARVDGVVRICEGRKDEAPTFEPCERLGTGVGPLLDLAIDPIEGTTLTSHGQPNAISVLVATPQGSMHAPQEVVYMNKIAVGPEASHAVDITASPTENLRRIAQAKGCRVSDLTVTVLDRPRHELLITECRARGHESN
jgi:fructose-1,6-bisphosphatase II